MIGFLWFFYDEKYLSKKKYSRKGNYENESEKSFSVKIKPQNVKHQGWMTNIAIDEDAFQTPSVKQSKLVNGKKGSKNTNNPVETTINYVQHLLSEVLPVEFQYKPWYKKFWLRILSHHPHLAYLSDGDGIPFYRCKKWLGFAGEVLNMMFVDCIMAPRAAPESTACTTLTTKEACLKPISIDLMDPLCKWKQEEHFCEHNEVVDTITVVLITTLIITCLARPLDIMLEFLVMVCFSVEEQSVKNESKVYCKAESYVETNHHNADNHHGNNNDNNNNSNKNAEDFDDYVMPFETIEEKYRRRSSIMAGFEPNTYFVDKEIYNRSANERTKVYGPSMYMLAARLVKLQESIDKVSPQKELSLLVASKVIFHNTESFGKAKYIISLLDNFNLHEDEETYAILVKNLEKVRKSAHEIIEKLQEISEDKEKEIYIARRFIMECLDGLNKTIARRYLFPEEEEGGGYSAIFKIFCYTVLITYILGTIFYIFLSGVTMGPEATNVWLICMVRFTHLSFISSHPRMYS